MFFKWINSKLFAWLAGITIGIIIILIIIALYVMIKDVVNIGSKQDRMIVQLETLVRSDSIRNHIQDSINKSNDKMMKRIPVIFPAPNSKISSTYGMRDSVMHWGVDISAKRGTPILSAVSGKVIEARYHRGYGNLTIIDSGLFLVKIAHQDSIFVTQGQEIKQGQLIGTVGNTGLSFGSHEHWEIIQDGKHKNPTIFF